MKNHGTLSEIEEAQAELEANAATGPRILLALHLAIIAQREFGRLRYLTFIGNNPSTGRSL